MAIIFVFLPDSLHTQCSSACLQAALPIILTLWQVGVWSSYAQQEGLVTSLPSGHAPIVASTSQIACTKWLLRSPQAMLVQQRLEAAAAHQRPLTEDQTLQSQLTVNKRP